MPTQDLSRIVDPKFPAYAYAAKPLVLVYADAGGRRQVANLFLGEWMKILDPSVPAQGRVRVRYRGGSGFVDVSGLSRIRHLEIYFIDVDQGDAILIQTPDDRRILVDGGQGDEAHQFIRTKYNLFDRDNYIDFDAVVATHSDSDHTQGLIPILKDPKIAVKRFYHNGLFRRQDGGSDPGPVEGGRVYGLVDRPRANDRPPLTSLMKRIVAAAEAAGARLSSTVAKMKKLERWKDRIDLPAGGGFVFKRLDAADGFLPPFDGTRGALTVEVLWPRARADRGRLSYPSYGKPGLTVNGNSVVLGLRIGTKRILLTGDLNRLAMENILEDAHGSGLEPAEVLSADVYKAAHHGSQDFSLAFLQAVQPDAAVISSGDNREDSHGHPRAVLLGTITRYSRSSMPAVFSTELAACFSPIPLTQKQRDAFMHGTIQAYEKSLRGIVHLRSDGRQLYLGTVHGRKAPDDYLANILWKWDIWPEGAPTT
jgi:beta-lactamase superfamily II metal-dependent hydrolase